jgi:hypothetical protein
MVGADAVRSTLGGAREIAARSRLGGPHAIGMPATTSDATVVGT